MNFICDHFMFCVFPKSDFWGLRDECVLPWRKAFGVGNVIAIYFGKL